MINLTDDLLRAAAVDVRNAMLDALPAPEECSHTFSPQFEQKMQKLIRQQKAGYRLLRQAAAVFFALLIGSSVWLMVNTEARAAFFRWVQEVYENSIVYRFFGDAPAAVDFANYRPTWLPEGYVEMDTTIEEPFMAITYRNSENNVVFFQCFPMNNSMLLSIIPDGEMIVEEVTINGMNGTFHQPENVDGNAELVWFDEDVHIAFRLSGPFEKSVILHIAENVDLVNSTN
jgi:hypothetical protein